MAKQWNDIKGNAKWALLGGVWWVVAWLSNHLVREIPNAPRWAAIIVPLLLSALAFVWLARRATATGPQRPTLAGGQSLTKPPFDVEKYAASAYDSPLAKEVESNVRQAMEARYPQAREREAFLLRFIGLGVVSSVYDITWAYIFRSQVLLLERLNRESLPLDQARVFYDKAVREHPREYANYSFDQGLGFLRGQVLIIQQGTMVGITVRGKDFLKHMVHSGRAAQDRRL